MDSELDDSTRRSAFGPVLFVLALGCAAVVGLWRFRPDSPVARFVDGPIRRIQAALAGPNPAEDRPKAQAVRPPPAPPKPVQPAKSASEVKVVKPANEVKVVKDANPAGDARDAKEPAAVEDDRGWTGLTDGNWYAGRRLAGRDLEGKVVLVYEFALENEDSLELLPRIEDAWKAFRHKPFAVIGTHRGGRNEKVRRMVAAKKVTFSVYEAAGHVREPRVDVGYPYLYVVDSTGRIAYRGRSDCAAIEAVVNAFGRLPPGARK